MASNDLYQIACCLEYELQRYAPPPTALYCSITWNEMTGTYQLIVLVLKKGQPAVRLAHPMKRLGGIPKELIAQLMMIG